MEKFIKTEGLSFSYPADDEIKEDKAIFALNDVNIDFDSGEYVAVLIGFKTRAG